MRLIALTIGLFLAASALATSPTSLNKHCNLQARYLLASQPIGFEASSAMPDGAAAAIIDALAMIAIDCPNSVISVDGHTDSRGGELANRRLSEARAAAVAKALIARGVPDDRIVTRGFGAGRPLADNATRDGRRTNRRIEVSFSVPRD